MQILSVTYSNWKNMRTFLGGTTNTYYIQDSSTYLLVLVDLSKSIVTTSHLQFSDRADSADFETNIKPTAHVQVSVDDCISSAISGI